jgi:hypothetical protein
LFNPNGISSQIQCADQFLAAAINSIDTKLGAGSSRRNPFLVEAWLKTALSAKENSTANPVFNSAELDKEKKAPEALQVQSFNSDSREALDPEAKEAAEFWREILKRVCDKYISTKGNCWPTIKQTIHIPTEEIIGWACEIRKRPELSTSWVKDFINRNHAAGRMRHLWYWRYPQRGYRVEAVAVEEELERREKEAHAAK